MGANGAGMLPLAICLAHAGHEVSAEDDCFDNEALEMLGKSKVVIAEGPELADDDMVVRSTAVSDEHPVVKSAKERGCAIMRRGDCLARMVEGKRLIAVAGSHGKSTTAAMLVDFARSRPSRIWAIRLPLMAAW